jgi:integrase
LSSLGAHACSHGGRPKGVRSRYRFVGLRRGRTGDYEPLTRSGVLQLVRSAAERAGITKRVHTHLLRHSFITNALRAGMNPLILARIAGHSSLRMIDQVYSHLNTTDTYEAMLRMLNATDEGGDNQRSTSSFPWRTLASSPEP